MHEIQALIGADAATAAIVKAWSDATRRVLAEELFIVPLTPALTRQMLGKDLHWPDLEDPDDGQALAQRLEPLLNAVGAARPAGILALVLTQYFGGAGAQAGLLLRDGRLEVGPLLGPGSINTVLRELGVRREDAGGMDEFDVVGLGRWRSSEEVAATG